MLPGGRRCPGAASGRGQVAVRKECIMGVSVTGATELTGNAIVGELPDAGHQGPGLATPAAIAADLA